MDIHMIFRRRPTGVMTAVMLVAVLLTAALAGCSKVPGIYVYEKAGSAQSGGAKAFDPKTYVDGIWASKIIPTVQQKAVDVTAVSAAIDKDPEAAGKQYGTRSGTGSPYAFMVKGTGTVTKLDAEQPTGPMTVQVPAAAGGKAVTVTIATGPVIAGTALRDAVGFIAFGDFTNQIDYANVANAINDRVKTDVIAKAGVMGLVGKKITFAGAFSSLVPGTIFLVPTRIETAA
jgi:predicted lipoprotein